jgi:hypothetical protein
MQLPMCFVRMVGTAALLLALPYAAWADQIRLHYVPTGPGGTAVLQPAGPAGAAGERVSRFGTVREPNNCPLRPNYLVTFRHAYTGQPVTVPISFPEGTPQLEHRGTRLIYNYGSYTIAAVFNPDGTVTIIYNSGFLRPL